MRSGRHECSVSLEWRVANYYICTDKHFFELEQVPRDRLCGFVVRLHIRSASASFRRLPRSSSGFLRPHQYECRLRAAQMTVSGA